MESIAIERLVTELIALEENLVKPFPYTSCRVLLQKTDQSGIEGLIPDLDLYFYDIASHSGGVKKILRWSKEKLLEAQNRLEKSFFEKHPSYKPLEPLITEANAPDLFVALMLHEKARQTLLELFTYLLSGQNQIINTITSTTL